MTSPITHWTVDRAGFPAVRILVASGPLWAQLWPLTKPQLEHFCCGCDEEFVTDSWLESLYGPPETGRDAKGDDGKLAVNPRESVDRLTPENYYRFFATGLRAEEAVKIGRWFAVASERDRAGGWRLPTSREWCDIYAAAAAAAPIDLGTAIAERIGADCEFRAQQAASRLEAAARVCKQRGADKLTLADLMFLRFGCYEWAYNPHVTEAAPRHVHGHPHRALASIAGLVDPTRPLEKVGAVGKQFGLRLVRSG